MLYEDFIQYVNNLDELISEYKKDNISSDKILKYLKCSHKIVNDDLLLQLINNYNQVKSCIKLIISILDLYSKLFDIDQLVYHLKTKEVTETININNVYQIVLDYMISNDIINDFYMSKLEETNSDVSELHDLSDMSYSDESDEVKDVDNFELRINQKEAFDKLEKYGLQKGILSSATGTGKSYIIIRYIDYTYRKFKNNCKIILFTERVNILKDLFELDSTDKFKEKISYWNNINIGNLHDINIIDRVTIKKYDWIKYFKMDKPILLLINRAFLSNKELYKQLNKDDISLVIHDECHNATSNNCFKIIKYFNDINIPIVGFSATPVRTGQKQIEKLSSIYGVNNKINLIINYGLIFAIENELIVPPIFNWYYFDNFLDDDDNIDVDSILSCLNNKINELPYRKLIAWCGYIELTKIWIKKIKNKINDYENLKNIKFYVDIDYNDKTIGSYKDFRNIENNGILFCAKKHREGSDIKNLDGCIFLDKAKSREAIPFIQCIGRVLRNNKNKKYGFIFDGLLCNDYKHMTDKIIDYYQTIQNLTHINDLNNSDNNNRIDNILESITYKNNKINLNIGTVNIIIDTMEFKINNKKLSTEFKSKKKLNNCRDPLLCMLHNDKLKHTIGKNDTWEFYYDKLKNKFIYNNKSYKTMNSITQLHYTTSNPNRTVSNNAWWECYIFRNNTWIRTHDLPLIEPCIIDI